MQGNARVQRGGGKGRIVSTVGGERFSRQDAEWGRQVGDWKMTLDSPSSVENGARGQQTLDFFYVAQRACSDQPLSWKQEASKLLNTPK